MPIQEAWDVTGRGPISSRWIDLDKGDMNKPNYRSRLVIQEVRHSGIDAIFAATPPLESLRFLLSLQRSLSSKKKYKIMLWTSGGPIGPQRYIDQSMCDCLQEFCLRGIVAASTRRCTVAVMQPFVGRLRLQIV